MDEKEIRWQGSSYKDLCAMPEKVRRTFGFALGLAQNGLLHPDSKSLKGFKPKVLEVLEDEDGDTFRAMYTVSFADAVYVLHCFKKKSTSGRNLPKRDRETIEARLAEIRQIEAARGRSNLKGSNTR